MSVISSAESDSTDYGHSSLCLDSNQFKHRLGYGIAASVEYPAESSLKSNYCFCFDDLYPIFQTDVAFDLKEVEVGQVVRIQLTITSLICGKPIRFSEMSLHFTDGMIIQRFVDIESPLGCDSGTHCVSDILSPETPCKFPLEFPYRSPVLVSFNMRVPEAVLKLSSGDLHLSLEKVRFTLPIVKTGTSTTNEIGNSNSELGKVVFFDVCTFSAVFLKARRKLASSLPWKEVVDTLGRISPVVLRVVPPTASLTMTYPPVQSMVSPSGTSAQPGLFQILVLQGIVQRVNIKFNSMNDSLRSGKVFLSSDFSPMAPEAALFWYPNLYENSNVCYDENSLRSAETADKVKFNPLVLSKTMQPMSPYLLPDIEKNSELSIPIFLRSESCGTVNVRLRFEYIPSDTVSSVIVKEFDIPVNVVKPLGMSFVMATSKDSACGVVKDPGNCSVLQGDIISMVTTVRCLNSLTSVIDILDLSVDQNEDTLHIFEIEDRLKSVEERKAVDGKISFKMPTSNVLCKTDAGDVKICSLRCKESFVGSVSIECLQQTKPSIRVDPSLCEGGNDYISQVLTPVSPRKPALASSSSEPSQQHISLCKSISVGTYGCYHYELTMNSL